MHRLFEKSRKTVLAIATHRSFLQNRIMNTVYLSTAYFAPVSYYASFLRYDRIVIEQWCNYTKQTYRNRCHTAGANRTIGIAPSLSSNPTRLNVLQKDIRISDHGEWRHLHWMLSLRLTGPPLFSNTTKTIYARSSRSGTISVGFQ